VVHHHDGRLRRLTSRAHPEALATAPAGRGGAAGGIGGDARAEAAKRFAVLGREAIEIALSGCGRPRQALELVASSAARLELGARGQR
jgi:hypothetical protein